jgi:hypothetical protein
MLGISFLITFLIALVAAVCIMILLKPDEYFTADREIVCPESHTPAAVQIDLSHRIRTLLRGGGEFLRLKSCSRWPERKACGEECLLQIDLRPKILDDVLQKWCAGKPCALCGRRLTENDWRLGYFSAVNDQNEFVNAREMPLYSHELTIALAQYRPVCRNCQSTQLAKRAAKIVLLKGDRRATKEEIWTGE